MAVQVNESILDQKLAELEKQRNWSARVISKLETTIRTGSDLDLFRINPIRYAADKNIAESEVIDLFLFATKIGLFEMEWHMVCAYCAAVVESLSQLSDVHAHFVCHMCGSDTNISLDDYIQVAFTISPQIRKIVYHEPASLPAEAYYYHYAMASGLLPIAGFSVEQVIGLINRALFDLQPNEKKRFEFDATPGLMQTKGHLNRALLSFYLHPEPNKDAKMLPVVLKENKFHVEGQPIAPVTLERDGIKFIYEQFTQISNPKIVVEIENKTDQKSPIWIVHYPPDFRIVPMEFEPFLSGKRLLTAQTFRDLFRTQVIQSDEGIAVKDLTYLFTDLKGSTEMYDRIGDPKAYYLVRQHFEILTKVIANRCGAIVKTIGDAIMATFMSPTDALNAATDMIKEFDSLNATITDKLILKIGIHRGHSIAVTLNDRVDYFGQSVNIAARVQALADSEEICLTQSIYEFPGVADLLKGNSIEPLETTVKGVRDKIQVYRIKAK